MELTVQAEKWDDNYFLVPIPQEIFDRTVLFYKEEEHSVHIFALRDIFRLLIEGLSFDGQLNCSLLIEVSADKSAYPNISYTIFNESDHCVDEGVFQSPYEVLDFFIHQTHLEDIPGLRLVPSLRNVNTGTNGKIVLDVNYTLQSLIDANMTIADALDMVSDNILGQIEEGVILSDSESLLETHTEHPYHIFKSSNPDNLAKLEDITSNKHEKDLQTAKHDTDYKIPSVKAFERLVKGMREDFSKEGIEISHVKLLNIVSKRIYGKPYEEVQATILAN